MIMKDEAGQYSGIKCDECDTSAPPAKEIMRGHGLNNMGWYCWGGVHLCPDHSDLGDRK